MTFRTEKDSLGEIQVASDKYWGAQTQRSFENFKIGKEKMPQEMIMALALVKKAAASANFDCGVLEKTKKDLIIQVCDEIISGKLNEHFPLVVWQTGSGTQTNMNLNEVIANRAEVLYKGTLTEGFRYISPNDDVNKSQSTNDVFPTAMRIASVLLIEQETIPELEALRQSFLTKSLEFDAIIKIGRTHLMDATPLRLGDEFSGYAAQLEYGIQTLKQSLKHLKEIPIGGTAVGTGLNTPEEYAEKAVCYIADYTQTDFKLAPNCYEAMSSHDAFVETSNAFKQLAVSLMKIANDIRLSGSGPRAGINELILPVNEPGSSIMPGKVNPTQCEAMTMVCCQIIGNDAAITLGGMQGHWQLNVFMPLIAKNMLHSSKIMADVVKSFNQHCIAGIRANVDNIENHLRQSLMLITALNPHIGYAKSAQIAQYAYKNNVSLKQSGIALQFLTEQEFDKWVDPEKMV